MTSGTLDYNALLVRFQRRFANGFSFLNSYTFGKAIDVNSDNDGLVSLTDIRDPGYNRGPADYDVTHTLSSSWIYELPFGRQSRLGGWQVNGIVYWRTGLPVTITQAGLMLSTGVPNNRPDRIGDGRAGHHTVEQWFDPPRSARPSTKLPRSAPRAVTSCGDPASSTSTCPSPRRVLAGAMGQGPIELASREP